MHARLDGRRSTRIVSSIQRSFIADCFISPAFGLAIYLTMPVCVYTVRQSS
jgi:hypothetical protein